MTRSAAVFGIALVVAIATGEAHKPITSPFTFNEHVFPILRQHCGACHVAGGVAPMSLMTHAEAVPWGESMRLELIAGHMPPWSDAATPGLSARELDTLMTWASGGTPPGDPANAPPPVTLANQWRLGVPDETLSLPDVTLDADTQERVAEFVLPTGPRALRAIDLRPGTPGIVRSATVSTRAGQTLLLWQPGDTPRAANGAAFMVRAGDDLVVRIRYKKTWEHERAAMTDRSAVGLYLADASLPAIERLEVTSQGSALDREVRVLAVAPGSGTADIDLRLDAVRPNGQRTTLVTMRPTAGWTRRYWLNPPVTLPRGTRLSLSASTATDPRPTLTLDIVPAP
jgi:hypothetical protein